MSTFCQDCGTARRPDSVFCGHCGMRYTSAGQPTMLIQPPEIEPIQQLKAGFKFTTRPYIILKQLGSGGMGVVYQAANQNLFNRPVVIKALINTQDPELQQQFEQEIRTLAQLHYPSIAPIIESFREAGVLYLVMEYVEGTDLEQQLEKQHNRPFPIHQVVEWGLQVAQMLEYLHSHQPPVVHHDIKPSNVVVHTGSKRLYLIDFGIAKLRLQQTTGGYKKTLLHGTPGYAPPEQYQGISEPRSDVYALAATLYHLATGDDPRDHPQTFPGLQQLPQQVQSILKIALNPDPVFRYSATQLIEKLQVLKQAATKQTDYFQAPMSSGLPPLIAPDNTHIESRHALGLWLQQQPDLAITWIQRQLPANITSTWGDHKLATEIIRLRQQYINEPTIVHDAVLGLLLPKLAKPQLEYPASIDLGKLGARRRLQYSLPLHNQSDRPVQLDIQGQEWLSDVHIRMILPPRAHYEYLMQIDLPQARKGQRHWQSALQLTPHNTNPISIPVKAHISRTRQLINDWLVPWFNYRTLRSKIVFIGLLWLALAHQDWNTLTSDPQSYLEINGIALAVFAALMLIVSPLISRLFRRRRVAQGRHGIDIIKQLWSVALTAPMLVALYTIQHDLTRHWSIVGNSIHFSMPDSGIFSLVKLGIFLLVPVCMITLVGRQGWFGLLLASLLIIPLLIEQLLQRIIQELPPWLSTIFQQLHVYSANSTSIGLVIALLLLPTWIKYRYSDSAT